MLLKGMNAIITGSNGGIGRATVELFAQNGANIWACMRNENLEAEKYFADLSDKYNVWIKPAYFDMANEGDTKIAIKEILNDKKAIDILVNNAGIAHGGFLQMTSLSTIHDVFSVNFFSQILIMQLVSRAMIHQKSGAIVNISSVAGLDGDAGYVAYGSSKAALVFATKSISKELSPLGIRVNAVAPGLTKTRMMDMMEQDARADVFARTSMQRAAEPKEIANAIMFLASEQASFVTGQILRVDGGE